MNRRRPERRTSSVEFVTTALYMDILEGVHAPGSFLRLNDVAEQLGVSMMPVREAIRELAALGLVEAIPHRGAQVRHLSIDDLVETYHGRIHLETLALKLGAANFTSRRAEQAWEANQRRLSAVEDNDAFASIAEHETLHFLLYEACESPWIIKALVPGWRNAARYRGTSMLDPILGEQLGDQHGLLIEAMSLHDAVGAVTLLHEHLTSAAESVAGNMAGVSIIDRLPTLDDVI